MDGIAALFDQYRHGGVLRLRHARSVKEIEKHAKLHGWAFFHIAGEHIHRKSEFLSHAALALQFPDYFGNNWDAFEDCLSDLSWVEGNGFVIYYERCDALAESAPDDMRTLLEVFADAAEYWHGQGRPMYVLLHALGEVSLPTKTWQD